MNRKVYAGTLALCTCLVIGFLTGCSSSNSTTPLAAIAATSGSGQSAQISAAFAAPLVATVTLNGTPVSGASVTFTAPASGASGTFATSGTATETDTTSSSGVATSSVFTANSTAGAYSVTASITGNATPASFNLTNTATTTTAFAFYLSGQEAPNTTNGEELSYYALAGAVTIDASGNVTAGEQDYNDGFAITSPTGGDLITGGTLTVDGNGQGTLTLITNNTLVGPSSAPGTETLGVQFANADHALIIQFDGSATSSGSLDLQTSLSSAPAGSFAFTLSGVDPDYGPIGIGGVFTTPTAAATDEVDANDDGDNTDVVAAPLTVSLGPPDAFGRGVATTSMAYSSTAISFIYYVVGPEVVRMIDVDETDSAVGSAFGQGSNGSGATSASLGTSIFGVSGGPWSSISYSTAGQFATTPVASPATSSLLGVGEDAEMETFLSDAASVLDGSYTINANGYGSLSIGGFGGGDVSALQLYATDPTLDLMDPNNANENPDLGGVLILDFDAALSGGTGVAITQTDTASADFGGSYAAGWQDLNDLVPASGCYACEFDMVANGTMISGGALTLSAEISDPLETLSAGGAFGTGTFTGTPTPDNNNPGRLTMLNTDAAPGGSLGATIGTSPYTDFDVITYQASASELFWIEYDYDSVFLGSLEVQGSLSGVPAVKRAAKVQTKAKH